MKADTASSATTWVIGRSPCPARLQDRTRPGEYAWGAESPETTHFSVVDNNHDAVALTCTPGGRTIINTVLRRS